MPVNSRHRMTRHGPNRGQRTVQLPFRPAWPLHWLLGRPNRLLCPQAYLPEATGQASRPRQRKDWSLLRHLRSLAATARGLCRCTMPYMYICPREKLLTARAENHGAYNLDTWQRGATLAPWNVAPGNVAAPGTATESGSSDSATGRSIAAPGS